MGFADGIPLVAGVTVASLAIIVIVAIILCCCCSGCIMYRKEPHPKLILSRSAEPSPTRTVISTTTSNGYTVTYTVCTPQATPHCTQMPLVNDLSQSRTYGLFEDPITSHVSRDRIHLHASHERLATDPDNIKMSDYDDLDDSDISTSDSELNSSIWVPRRDLRKVRIHEPKRRSYVDLAS